LLLALGGAISLPAQGWLERLDRLPLPDSAKIDSLNDHAWSLSKLLPDSALHYAVEANRRAEQVPYARGIINAQIVMGIVNKDKGFYSTSVGHYLRALSVADSIQDYARVSTCLNNLGAVYQAQENYAKALENFKRSLQIEEEHGTDKGQRSIRLYNIGESYLKLDSLDKANAYYYNSLLIEEELHNPEGIFYARLGLGQVDTRRNNPQKAEQELAEALRLGAELKDNYGLCETQIALGNLHLSTARLALAEEAFTTALLLARGQQYQALEIQALKGLFHLQKQKGEFAKALETQEAYHNLQAELNSVAVANKIAEMQMAYELEKKEALIKSQAAENEVNRQLLKYAKRLGGYLLLIVVMVVVLAGYNFWRSRKVEEHD
jgi:tetratricopeptide (TPR) repeat protein